MKGNCDIMMVVQVMVDDKTKALGQETLNVATWPGELKNGGAEVGYV